MMHRFSYLRGQNLLMLAILRKGGSWVRGDDIPGKFPKPSRLNSPLSITEYTGKSFGISFGVKQGHENGPVAVVIVGEKTYLDTELSRLVTVRSQK